MPAIYLRPTCSEYNQSEIEAYSIVISKDLLNAEHVQIFYRGFQSPREITKIQSTYRPFYHFGFENPE